MQKDLVFDKVFRSLEEVLEGLPRKELYAFAEYVCKKIYSELRIATKIAFQAKKRVLSWKGSKIEVVVRNIESDPRSDDGVSWSIYVYVGRASFALFGDLVDDVLEDYQDFSSSSEMEDYQNLIKEIRQPNSTKKGKTLILYTAQPKGWSRRLKGVFLTSSFSEAEGMAEEKGRSVYKVRIPSTSVIETKSGRTKWYQVVSETKAVEMSKLGTLSNSEKEEREDKRLVKQAPKKKPPRKDTKRNRVKDSDNSEKDPDKEQDKKDRSKNYKDAAYRVALRYMLGAETKMVTVRRKEDGKLTSVSEETLKGPDKGLYEEFDWDEVEPPNVDEDPLEEDEVVEDGDDDDDSWFPENPFSEAWNPVDPSENPFTPENPFANIDADPEDPFVSALDEVDFNIEWEPDESEVLTEIIDLDNLESTLEDVNAEIDDNLWGDDVPEITPSVVDHTLEIMENDGDFILELLGEEDIIDLDALEEDERKEEKKNNLGEATKKLIEDVSKILQDKAVEELSDEAKSFSEKIKTEFKRVPKEKVKELLEDSSEGSFSDVLSELEEKLVLEDSRILSESMRSVPPSFLSLEDGKMISERVNNGEDIREVYSNIEERLLEIEEVISKNKKGLPPKYIVREALKDIPLGELDNLSEEEFNDILREAETIGNKYEKGSLEAPTNIESEIKTLREDFQETLSQQELEEILLDINFASDDELKEIRRKLEDAETKEKEQREKSLKEQKEKLKSTPLKEREKRKKSLEEKKEKGKINPEEERELLSIQQVESLLSDPLEAAQDLPEEGEKPDPSKQESKLKQRALSTFDSYKNSDSESICSNIRKIKDTLKELDPTDARTQEISAMLQGLRFAEIYAKNEEGKGDDVEGVGSASALIIDWAMKEDPENLSELMYAEIAGGGTPANAKAQEIVNNQLNKVTDSEWIKLIPEGHPARALAEVLGDTDPKGKGRFLTEQDRAFLREQIIYVLGADVAYDDPANISENPNATVRENRERSVSNPNRSEPPNLEDYDLNTIGNYRLDLQAWREAHEASVTEPFRDEPDESVTDPSAEAERRLQEQERELEERRKEQERALEERRREMEENTEVGRRVGNFNIFSINSLYNKSKGNLTFRGAAKMRKVSRRQARELTRAMDEMATTIQKMARQLGIPQKVARDFALRTDLISDAIEKNANFDASSIGRVVPGPLEMIDSDEPWMNGHFTQEDGEELYDMQESGSFSNARAASRRSRSHRASISRRTRSRRTRR